MFGGLERRVLEQCLERHEIARRQRGADGGLHLVRQLDRIHDPLEELRVADVDLVAADAGRLHAAGGEGDHLGVGHRA